jgi:hypothetical protein
VSTASSALAPSLRRLYFTRFAFALVWAALLIATASDLGPAAVTLLVLYPLFDVAAAIVDVWGAGPSSRAWRSSRPGSAGAGSAASGR